MAMRTFGGSEEGVTVKAIRELRASEEVAAVTLGRSGVFRWYILPFSRARAILERYGTTDALHISVNDLRDEATMARLIMKETFAVLTVSRGYETAFVVPADLYWESLLELDAGAEGGK